LLLLVLSQVTIDLGFRYSDQGSGDTDAEVLDLAVRDQAVRKGDGDAQREGKLPNRQKPRNFVARIHKVSSASDVFHVQSPERLIAEIAP
jgi:hypothetical protein